MKMKIAALALLASALPALAQTPSFYLLKDAASPQNSFQMRIFTQGGVSTPASASSDASGNPLSGAAGTTNPNNTALFVQGVTGGLPLPITFATPQHVICDSGCSGSGGGGLSVPFGGSIGANGTPVGFKDGSGNFQPLIGDVTNGLWVAIKSSVSIGVTGTFWQATQPVSAASLPLPTGAATQTTLASILSALGSPFQAGGSIANTSFGISGTLPAFAATPTFNCGTGCFQATQPVSGTVTANAGTNLNTSALALESGGNLAQLVTDFGAPGAVACTTDTASCNLNQQMQRNNQRLSSLITAVGSPFQAGGSIGNTTFASTQSGTWNITNISGTVSLPTGAASAANQTNASQKTQIVDGSGNVIASTSNNLNVQCANCSGSGVSTGDEASFTAGTSLFAGGGGFFQTTPTNNALTTGQQGMFQVTANRALFTNLRNASGTEIGTSSTPVQVSLANTGANGTALLVTGTAGTFPVTGTVTANAGTNLNTSALALETGGNLAQLVTDFGAPGATACTTDTASCNLNQQMQRNNQRLTTINTTLGTPFQAGASIGNTSFAATQATASNLNATVVGTGTFAVQATLQASASTAIGKVDPNTIGSWGLQAATQNSATPTNGGLVLGQFNTSPTTITSGNVSPLQLDNAGNLLVNIKAGASSGAVAQGSTTSGQTGGLTQAAALSSAPTYSTGTTNPLTMDTSGALRVNVTTAVGLAQGSTTSGQTGSLVMGAVTTSAPTYTTAQTSPLSIDTSGNLRTVFSNTSIAVTNAGTFAVQATQAGTWNVTNISGTVSLPTGASTSANQPTNAAIASTTSGQTGNLQMGAVSTSAPTYTTAQTNPLSLTTAGALRVDGSSVTQPVSNAGTFAVQAAQSGTWNIGSITTLPALVAGSAIIGKVGIDQTTPGTTNGVQVNAALPAGTNLIGKLGIDQTTPGTTNGTQDAATGSVGSAVPAKASYSGSQGSNGLAGEIVCDQSAVYDASTNGSTQLVALSSGKSIYVCGWTITTGATATNVKLIYGTGTACVTSPQPVLPAFQLGANSGVVDSSAIWGGIKTAASQELCINTSAGNPVQAVIKYAQF